MSNDPGKQANRLIHATSPYLLQHAYNPVDWYEWGPEALDKANREDKPILVSIGYSACHWCHVMERESFESTEIARIMNENFVCIKVDREERPDVDQVYMEAVQAMGGNGGWPLNVFLNPARKPFYGGTYFPPGNWERLLSEISKAFRARRTEIDASADSISDHLNVSDLHRFRQDPGQSMAGLPDLDAMAGVLESRYDHAWGGLEKAPKFVMPTIWMFLLRYHVISGKQEPLDRVVHTLTKMTEAGLYDPLGGGFCRYSVDREWFAPHFEKMLYDNAQLLSLYSEAYSVTREPLFKTIVVETVGWLEREMTHPEGGFYSALDADSEGVEGKYYTWTASELHAVLGDRAPAFFEHFGITEDGNWEHGRNILNRGGRGDEEAFDPEKKILMQIRNRRIRPGLDDKILTGWNAMMITGLTDAYRAFGESRFLDLAERNIRFIEDHLIEENIVYRSFKNRRGSTPAFLEDHAFLIQAYLGLYHSTFQEHYLRKAEQWCHDTFRNFFDPKEGYFHFTGAQAEPLIARKKELFDNVIPSSNSVMARNLYHLGILLDEGPWKVMALNMLSQLRSIISSEPGYMSNWGVLLSEVIHGTAEVVVAGPDAVKVGRELSGHYLPFASILGSTGESTLPLLAGRIPDGGRTMIYVCFDKTCKLPVESVSAALLQLTTS